MHRVGPNGLQRIRGGGRGDRGEIAPADEVLLLADSLRSQTKSEFIAAVKASVRAITMFGVKNGSHVWQPVDHHVGAAYKRKMDGYYVEWMANCVPDLAAPSPTIPVGKRRQLLTEWAARAYRELEVARETAEREGRPSLFEAAFLRTGCLVTVDGTADDEIRPHASIVDALATRFKAKIRAPHTFTPVELGEEESPLPIDPPDADISDPVEGGEDDSEDWDDDPPEGSDDTDGEREPVPDDLELEVEDEGALIQRAAAAAREESAEVLRDFQLAARLARQDSVAVRPQFAAGAARAERASNARRNEIYAADLAAHEARKGKKASARQVDRIWNEAAAKALAEVEPSSDAGGAQGRRASARNRRGRL